MHFCQNHQLFPCFYSLLQPPAFLFLDCTIYSFSNFFPSSRQHLFLFFFFLFFFFIAVCVCPASVVVRMKPRESAAIAAREAAARTSTASKETDSYCAQRPDGFPVTSPTVQVLILKLGT